MNDDAKMQYAANVFAALVSDTDARLRRGLALRKAMHEALARGEDPQGYRPKWLKATSLLLVKFIGDQAEKFDAEHPDDRVSVADILDLLHTTTGIFTSQVAEDGDEAEDRS